MAAALATHFDRGRDFSKAVTYVIQAGDNAVSRYANAEAVSYYTRGLELIQKLPEAEKREKQIVLLRKRAAAHMALGRLNDRSLITWRCGTWHRPPATRNWSAAL